MCRNILPKFTLLILKFFLLLSEVKLLRRKEILISSSKIRRHRNTDKSTVAGRGGIHDNSSSRPERITGRLISISWMCLCTFISTPDWHFHHNYWTNHLTSDGSDLACSLRSATFLFFFSPPFLMCLREITARLQKILADGVVCAFVCASVVYFVDLLRPRLLWMLHFLERLSLWHFVVTAQNTMQTERKARETDRKTFTGWQGGGQGGREREKSTVR